MEVDGGSICEWKVDSESENKLDEVLKMLGRDTTGFSKYSRGVEAAGLATRGQQSANG